MKKASHVPLSDNLGRLTRQFDAGEWIDEEELYVEVYSIWSKTSSEQKENLSIFCIAVATRQNGSWDRLFRLLDQVADDPGSSHSLVRENLRLLQARAAVMSSRLSVAEILLCQLESGQYATTFVAAISELRRLIDHVHPEH